MVVYSSLVAYSSLLVVAVSVCASLPTDVVFSLCKFDHRRCFQFVPISR